MALDLFMEKKSYCERHNLDAVIEATSKFSRIFSRAANTAFKIYNHDSTFGSKGSMYLLEAKMPLDLFDCHLWLVMEAGFNLLGGHFEIEIP